jgi:hypothetical protein
MEREEREQEWAVRVHCAIGVSREIPGPHDLECSSQEAARMRLEWWQKKRPDVRAELLRREVVTTYGPWVHAGPHGTCIDVTATDQTPRSEWICGPECPTEA